MLAQTVPVIESHTDDEVVTRFKHSMTTNKPTHLQYFTLRFDLVNSINTYLRFKIRIVRGGGGSLLAIKFNSQNKIRVRFVFVNQKYLKLVFDYKITR